jgi:hypothetical protein
MHTLSLLFESHCFVRMCLTYLKQRRIVIYLCNQLQAAFKMLKLKVLHILQNHNQQETYYRISTNCFLILGIGCGMAWTFERHANRELRGFTNAHYATGSKTECEDRCLDERSFTCR